MVKSNTTIMMVGIIVVLIFIGLPSLEALSPMEAPAMSPGSPTATPTDCTTALTNVSSCLNYVLVGSNLTVPDKDCCPSFAGLLESNPICLCQLIGQAGDFGVDTSRALMLPGVCKLTVPSLDACPGSPASAPAPNSPTKTPRSPAAGQGPGGAAGPGPGGAASSPSGSGNGGNNGAFGTTVLDHSTIVCLAVAIFISYYF